MLFVRAGLDGEARALLDPNSWSEDGTVSLASNSVSPNGRYIAYAKSDGGSDWRDWYVREVASGEDLPDHLTYTKFTGVSWTPDERGFYYSRYPVDGQGAGDDKKAVSVYYHELGRTRRTTGWCSRCRRTRAATRMHPLPRTAPT